MTYIDYFITIRLHHKPLTEGKILANTRRPEPWLMFLYVIFAPFHAIRFFAAIKWMLEGHDSP